MSPAGAQLAGQPAGTRAEDTAVAVAVAVVAEAEAEAEAATSANGATGNC